MSIRLARSASVVALAATLSRVLGVVRDAVIARFFGAGDVMDAFNVATRIPSLLRELLAEGAMSSAFVPAFTKRLAVGGRFEAWRLGSLVLNALLLVSGGLVVLGILFAGPLTRLYAGDYAGVPISVSDFGDKLALTVAITRIVMPFLVMIVLAAAMMAMLNALGRFFFPAFAPAAYNVVISVCAAASAVVGPRFGIQPVFGLAAGFVLGGAAQMLVQGLALRREGFRHQWRLEGSDPGLREVLAKMGPGTVGQAAVQVNILVNMWLATGEGTGAVSWLTYASRIMFVPVHMFGVSLATASFPEVARSAADRAFAEVRRTLSFSLRLMLMLVVPASFALLVLAEPLVALIFEGRQFTPRDTEAVAAALVWYAPGLAGYATTRVLSPAFYALDDARTPMVVSIVTVGVNLALNLVLVRLMGYVGLALGATLAASTSGVILVVAMARRVDGLERRRIGAAFARITVASAFMAAAAWAAELMLRQWFPAPVFLARLARIAGAAAVGTVVLVAAAHILRIEEFRTALRRLVG
jgi:putative peptidoglycan lipid II flippase